MPEERPYAQLHMVWPGRLLGSPPTPRVPEGYELRAYTHADEANYIALMTRAGFEGWSRERVAELLPTLLPEGFFVIDHRVSGTLVATAMARHRPTELHPEGGELSWVAADPAHAGRGLGLAVCAAVTARFIRAGYRRIYLMTDDWRLPALKTYLKLGYEPFLFRDDMADRWATIHSQLGRPPSP